jgi:hypothetical protein
MGPSSKAAAEASDLRELAKLYGEELDRSKKKAYRLGSHHRVVQVGVGVFAVVAGVVAGVTGLAETNPLITGIAGFTASALAAITPTLDAKRLASFHFSQAGEYDTIGKRFEVLATGAKEPSEDELNSLIDQIAASKARRVEDE